MNNTLLQKHITTMALKKFIEFYPNTFIKTKTPAPLSTPGVLHIFNCYFQLLLMVEAYCIQVFSVVQFLKSWSIII